MKVQRTETFQFVRVIRKLRLFVPVLRTLNTTSGPLPIDVTRLMPLVVSLKFYDSSEPGAEVSGLDFQP